MSNLFQIVRSRIAAVLALSGSFVVASTAFAQDAEPAASGDKSNWVLSYALVILAIALGLTAVCRPGNRSKDVKVDDD